MKRGYSLATCIVCVLAVISSSVQVTDGSQEQFLRRSDHEAASWTASLETLGSKNIQRLRSSWMTMWSEPDKLLDHAEMNVVKRNVSKEQAKQVVEKPSAKAPAKGKQDSVPKNRQQMYFRPVSVTLMCVMSLTIASLLVYTALSISRNYDELSASFRPSTITQTLTIASRVANFAPMLCMLFVACRMYILATTEGLGEPPAWVKLCMWGAVIGVAAQFVVVVCLPMFSKQAAVEEAEYDMTEGAIAAYQEARRAAKNKDEAEAKAAADAQEPDDLIKVTGEYTDVHPHLGAIEYNDGQGFMKPVFWITQIVGLALLYCSILGVIVGIWSFKSQTTKISPAVQCTIVLSRWYFGVCLTLWISRAIPESDFQTKFTHAALSMSGVMKKAPMFAVLFLASRMRALNLDPPYGMPPFWMQCCFHAITGLVILETIASAGVGFKGEIQKAYYGVYIFKIPSGGGWNFLHYVQHLSALTSYAILPAIFYGITLMEATDGHPAPLSTTLRCVVIFQGMYFFVMFCQGMLLFGEEAGGVARPMRRDAAVSAGISLGLAPLLSILFVATRMRALQITQQQGSPPGWAQDCMLLAIFATGVQAVCCLVMPIFIGKACKVDADGNPDYDLEPMIGAYAVAIVKYVALLTLHGSVIAICMSVFVMTPETAHEGGRFLKDPKQFFQGLLIVAGVFFVALLLSSAKVVGMAIKIAIESVDQALLGVDITIKACSLNAFKGYVQVNDLVVHQPEDEIIYTTNDKGKLEGKKTGEKNDWKYDYIARVHLVLIKINLWRLITSLGKEFELENLSLTGVYVNVEKPDMNLKAKNSNVEYIMNYIDSLGLLPHPEDSSSSSAKPEPKKPEEKKEKPKKEEPEKKKDGSGTKVVLHKIHLGNMGVSVTVQKVKILGEVSFQPSIGELKFDDIQRDIFGGREDLTPGETVACVIQAIALKIFKEVAIELPKQLVGSAGSIISGVAGYFSRGLARLRGHHEHDEDEVGTMSTTTTSSAGTTSR